MLKDGEQPQQPRERTPKERERYEREKAEDERHYQHYLETGECIPHEEMMAWFDRLERQALLKAWSVFSV